MWLRGQGRGVGALIRLAQSSRCLFFPRSISNVKTEILVEGSASVQKTSNSCCPRMQLQILRLHYTKGPKYVYQRMGTMCKLSPAKPSSPLSHKFLTLPPKFVEQIRTVRRARNATHNIRFPEAQSPRTPNFFSKTIP